MAHAKPYQCYVGCVYVSVRPRSLVISNVNHDNKPKKFKLNTKTFNVNTAAYEFIFAHHSVVKVFL